MSDQEKPAAGAEIIKGKAARFARDHAVDLREEVHQYVDDKRMPEMKFIELFQIPRDEIKDRMAKFETALADAAEGKQPDKRAMQDGLNMTAGMVMISANADGMAPKAADPKEQAKRYRKRNELGDQPLTGRDKKRIRELAAQAASDAQPLEQDAAKWKDAAAAIIDLASRVGVNTEGYAEGLGLRGRA